MSIGPALIYDKSAMQRLTTKEANWLTHFFRCNITPVYLMEVLGDLAKAGKGGTPESLVSALAAKTQAMGSQTNVEHTLLIDQEILGNPVEMRGVPIVGGAQQVTAANGEKGFYFDVSPEDRALGRWREREFRNEEHQHAARYRKMTKAIDLQAFIKAAKATRTKGSQAPATLSDLLMAVDLFLDNPATQYRTLTTALEMFDQPEPSRRHAKKQWAAHGRPPICAFVPYTHYCLRVSMLFSYGVGLGLISQRPTNIIDMQYLYYLPFCMVFTSADNLHHDMAPLFLKRDQVYVKSDDIQGALRSLTAYYDDHEAELHATGTMGFARYPPLELDTEIHRVYDRVMPRWRADATTPPKKITPKENARIMEKLRPMIDAINVARKGVDG